MTTQKPSSNHDSNPSPMLLTRLQVLSILDGFEIVLSRERLRHFRQGHRGSEPILHEGKHWVYAGQGVLYNADAVRVLLGRYDHDAELTDPEIFALAPASPDS